MTENGDDIIAGMQFGINQQIYGDVVQYYNSLLDQTDPSTAIRLIVTALSTNLGAIIAQLPYNQQAKYTIVAKEILDSSMSLLAEDIAASRWGKVGHA